MPSTSGEDWGRICALLAHLYGFKPWDIAEMTQTQVKMYLDQAGFIRFQRDLATLQYSFSKLGEDGWKKLIEDEHKPPTTNSLSGHAWRIFVRHYGAMNEEAEDAIEANPLAGLSRDGAAAMVAWVESQEMSSQPNGAAVWRLRLLPLWESLKATARG